MRLNGLDWIAYTLVVIGGLNWGLVGIFDFNLVTELFGVDSALSNIVFAVVGLAALYMLLTAAKLTHHEKETSHA